MLRVQAELTANQKECLRLVAQGMTSKEISARIGLSPSTVDTYLRAAAGSLGAINRRDAARRFLAAEQRPGEHGRSERLRYQSAAVAGPPVSAEETAMPVAEGSPASALIDASGLLRPPPIGGLENDLGVTDRLIEVMRIALFLAAVMTGLVLFAWGAIKILS